ncbi:MAG: fibronectin type III domain-containing protein [Bacteroidota bacterium]
MKHTLYILFFIVLLLVLWSGNMVAQSVANYTPARTTGVAYNSISSTGNAVNAWRTINISDGSYYDDNRSYPVLIGFDFWYDGKRYTQFSVSTNGFMDFDTSSWNGGSGSVEPNNPYGPYSTDFVNPTRSAPAGGIGTVTALAPIYFDLTTWQTSVPLGNSIMYQLTGAAPNRVLTVEWVNMSTWVNQNDTLNFQVKLYESTGVIEYDYGYMAGTIAIEAGFGYVTGINAPSILPNPPTAAQLLCLQTENTNTFSNGQQNQLTAMPQNYSRYTFTPKIPATPSNLTFSAVTPTSMTLNWTDNASNEVGYAIYNSTDGINYTFVTQLAANSISYPAAGLSPGTTYYWNVYAVTEGGLSASLNGSQATTAATNFTSFQTGNWNTGSTWVGGVVPTANANVTIANTHTVTIDGNITVNNLTIGQGASGILQIGNSAVARTLNVFGNITVNAGAIFRVNAASATSGHILNLTGNIINNGTFDLGPSATTRCQTVFNRAGNQTISGTGATTDFYLMTLNMGTTNSNVLDITSSNFSTQSTGFLTITNGTFKYEAPGAITPFTASFTIPLTGGLWLNNSSAIVSTTGGNLSVIGYLRVTNGTLNVGTAADQQLLSNGGTFIIEGGAVNVAGSFVSAPYAIMNFTISGGTFTVATVSSTLAGQAPFMLTIAGSTFSQTGGTIVIRRAGSGNFGYINTNAASYSALGGMLQIGDYATPAGQTMQVNTNNPVFNFTDSSANATAQLVTNNLTVNNNVLIAAGTVNANNLNITVSGNWTDQGTFTPGTGTVTFTGLTSTAITDATGETFYNLTINKSSATVTENNNVTVNNAFTITLGTFAVGSSILTLNGAVTSSGTLTSNATGTVNYNQGSAGQTVLTASYGNLTLSAFSKTFPASTVGVASVLTAPNPATAHVMTGNTINFNGSGAQTVTATTANFVYNNLTLSNSGTKSAGGAIAVASTLTVGNSITFDGVTNNITVNGNISNSGSVTGSGAGVVVLTGGASAHALSGGGSYRSITLNDANGATLSGNSTINGTLTFTSGVITIPSTSDILSISSTGSITQVSGYVIGNLQMYIPTGASSNIFYIGTVTKYLPVRLQFANVGTAGQVTLGRRSNQQHPKISDASATVDSTQDVKAYWIITNNGVVLTGTYTATFGFDAANECIGGVSPLAADFNGSRWNGSAWSYVAPGLRTADSTRLDALNAFGDFILGKSRAALIFAIKTGLWDDATVWSSHIPGQNDTAKIVSPFTVTLDANVSVAKLDVNAGSTFNSSTFILTITGGFILNGTWTGAGTISLTTSSDSIYGSGSMTGTSVLEIAGTNKAIASTANLQLKQVSILSGETLNNKGTVTIDSLTGAAATSTFVNFPGSILTINGPLLQTGSLSAATCPNTVIYNGTVAETIKPTTYCNIIMNNNGVKTASANFDTNGDLTVNLGSNLTIGSGVLVQVRGITTTSGAITNGGNLLISD